VALFHGGGWAPGGRRPDVWSVVRSFAHRGYAVWNVGYRVLGTGMGGGWPHTFVDAATAVDLLQEVAGRWPIDPEAVLTVGVSAGGTLATWCAGRSGLPEGAPGSSPVIVPKGTISCAGLLDLAWNAEGGDGRGPAPPELISSAVVGLMGGPPESRPVRYELASPIDRLPFHVPSLVAQGRNDRVAMVGQARRFAVRAKAKGDDSELLLLDDAEHSDWDDAASAGWEAVFAALPAFVERCDLPARPRP
jgi:acetyl esterase/lipase